MITKFTEKIMYFRIQLDCKCCKFVLLVEEYLMIYSLGKILNTTMIMYQCINGHYNILYVSKTIVLSQFFMLRRLA